MTTATYTREQLTKREFTRSKLEEIAIGEMGLNEDVVSIAAKKTDLIDMILLAQMEEEAVGIEPQMHSEEPDVVETESEYLEPVEGDDDPISDRCPCVAVPAEVCTGTSGLCANEELTYEQRLMLYLDECHTLDEEASYLLSHWAEFKQSLIAAATSTNRRQPRSDGSTPRTRTTDPSERIAQAKAVWEKVQELGTAKAAAEALGKSAHYTKMIARAYDIYQQSKVIATAYDSGKLPWTQLYDIAFRNRVEKEGLVAVEAAVQAIAA